MPSLACSSTVRVDGDFSLGHTISPLRRGRADLAMTTDRTGAWWRASLTPLAPPTPRLARVTGAVEVSAWGPGAEWAVETAPDLLGAGDRLDGFEPGGLVRELHRRMPGLRIPRSMAVFEAVVPSVLEQKVLGVEARSAYRGA